MNEVIEAIRKRRSVRSYESKPVPKDIIKMIIEAGNEAPSAMNSQPWRFVVFEDEKIKEKLLEMLRCQIQRRFWKWLKMSIRKNTI